MKSHQLLSDKDLQVLKVTYRTVIQNYYDNPSQQNSSNIILLNQLTTQTISTHQQSDSLLLISILQILKVKTKSNKQLTQSIQNTIIHLKNPLKIYIKNNTILQCLEKIQIYALCCIIINRFYQAQLKPRSDSYGWKQIINNISKNCDKNMLIALQTIVHILPDFPNFSKQINKNGMIKYLCSIYLPQILQDKINLYRSLKILKIVANNDKTVLPSRQKNIGLVIYNYPAYILIIQQIEQLCYQQQYCQKVLNNIKDIDAIYVWSYNTNFCNLSSQGNIDQLQKVLKQNGKNINVQLQFKIYTIINNFVKISGNGLRISQGWKIPIHTQKNLNAYLKLVISLIQRNGNDYKNIDIKAIEYVYDKSKTTDPLTDKLIKDLKNLDSSNNKKIGKLQCSVFQHYSVEKNPQILMQKAAKIPRSNQDLRLTQQILALNNKNSDQLQSDIIKTLKNKSIQTLKTSIVQKLPVDLSNIFNKLIVDCNDPQTINKLLKLGQLNLTMDPDSADKYNQNKFLQILQWLENNHGIQIIDWVAAGQMLAIIFGPEQWMQHLGEIPKRCFWLLNASDSDKNGQIFAKINSVALNHPKIPILVGFISKTGDPQLKAQLLKSKPLQHILSEICTYKNSRSSTKPYKPQQDISDGQHMNKYLINILNLSYFIYNWSKSLQNKQIQSKIIKSSLDNVIRNFNGYQHQFRYLQNCLPYKINIKQLKDINVTKLLQNHGKLTSYLHINRFMGRIDFSKISTISSQTDASKIEEILRFLQENPDMIQCSDLIALLDRILKNTKKQPKYWKFYPNYMSILNHLTDIATKSTNPQIIDKITDILQKLINNTAENQDITEDQYNQLYENLYNGLQRLMQRKIKIDANRLKRQAEKINDKEWKKKIMDRLKIMNQMNIQVKPNPPAKVVLTTETETKQQPVGNKYQTKINPQPQPQTHQQTKSNSKLSQFKMQDTRIQASVLSIKQQDASKLNISNLQTNNNQFQQKKDQNIYQGTVDTNQILKNQQNNLPNLTPQQKRLLDALKMLKKIIQKQQPKQTFPKLVQIFLTSQFNKNHRYVLGHLLTQYYQIIQKDKRCITLLQMKDKTNLSKQICYKFLVKFQQAFGISKRWKLSGYQFLDLSIQRIQCRNQNKSVCIENGCQIIQYNLIKPADLQYFESKKYYNIVIDLFPHVQSKIQAIFYLLLIGSSARPTNIKLAYIMAKLHIKLLNYTNNNWLQDKRICANLSYAVSSLVYTQNQIAIQIAVKKQQMLKIMDSYHKLSTIKSVVQSGCSLLSNLCYSNKQTKQILYSYGINQLLIQLMNKNLIKPQVSTSKQIMRTLGNISLHKPSAQKLINGHICQSIVSMIQKFNILIYRDDQKLKVLKLVVDFFSNIASHKYNLQTIHQQGVSNFIITILQTTQISQDHILMACIDTIDGLCQNQQIQNYVVMDKKLLLQLIDLLKIKQDQKLITKSIRLLTNMTLNQVCIPYILQANLLSVLANIVLSVYRNQKIDIYINKIILRIFTRKPDTKLILKSGYLDCLMKAIEITQQIDDGYIDILLYYCQFIPNYLNHRAFFNIVKVLTKKQNQKDIVDKCFKVIRVIFSSSQEKQEDDILIQGSSLMYQRLLVTNQTNKIDIVYLLGLHCTKSRKFKKVFLIDHNNKKTNIVQFLQKLALQENTRQLACSVIFTILNKDRILVDVGQEIVKQQDFAYKILTKGLQCKLFRMDGSSKNAIVDINQMYMIRAYKYPDGQIKKKYIISIRQLRDWQFDFQPNDEVWKNSVFAKERGLFEGKPKIENCVTLLGSQQWGQFSLINLEFCDTETKILFIKAISALVLSFKV